MRALVLLDHLLDAVLRAVHPHRRVPPRVRRGGQPERVRAGEEGHEAEERAGEHHVRAWATVGRKRSAVVVRGRAR